MAEKTLNAYVVLGGKVDNSFQKLGQNLVNLGSSIDGISQKLINFGKESVQTYRSYEDSMLEAQVALSTSYGRGSKALKDVMSQLDRQASEWAATTIFHTDDVANAIAEAAHANWDLEKIMEGLPAAMRLAQAGGLDLSTGLDYIIKSVNAAGISFSDLNTWIDEWTYTANRSAADVEEFGQAMTKMGSTMKFADNKEELLTMLAVLHDAGTTGDSAGTLLRNTMIRLIAPTKKASDVMKELGVAQSDIDEAMGETDGDLNKVMKTLEKLGFSAYDKNGNLKDMTTIFEDLAKATSGMSDKEKLGEIWSALFPTRTITGAMALIEAADKNWNGLLDDLKNGKANGYGEYAQETMMSGLTGAIETFNSKVEELRKELGEQLSPQLKTVVENFGKFVDMVRTGGVDNGVSSGLDWIEEISGVIGSLSESVGDMDPALFDALVAGLGSIAALGPMLLIGGYALRGIGNAVSLFTGSTIGKMILAAAAISVVATAMKAYNDAKFLENFGEMQIDTTGLDEKMTAIHDAFEKAKAPTQGFADALGAAVKNYTEASTTFSATMMEDLLADQTLTGDKLEAKLKEYRGLGTKMIGALKDGINASADMSAEFWQALFSGKTGENADEETNAAFIGLSKALDEEKGSALKTAEKIGKELEAKITEAWGDGTLTEEERMAIKTKIEELNQAMIDAQREAQNRQDFINRKQMLSNMQNMSYTQMMDYLNGTVKAERDTQLEWWNTNYNAEKFGLEYDRDQYAAKETAARNRGDTEAADMYAQKVAEYNAIIAQTDKLMAQKEAEIYAQFDQPILDWFMATLNDSKLGNDVMRQAAEWAMGGIVDPATLQKYLADNGVGLGDAENIYGQAIKLLGGIDQIQNRIDMYEKGGDTKSAKKLQEILAIYSIAHGDTTQTGYEYQQQEIGGKDIFDLYNNDFYGAVLKRYMNYLSSGVTDEELMAEEREAYTMTGDTWVNSLQQHLGEIYDMDMLRALLGGGIENEQLRGDYALARLLNMSEAERQKYLRGGEASNLFQAEMTAQEKQAAYDAALDSFYNHPISGSYHTGMEPTSDIQALGQAAEAAWDLVEELGGTRPGQAPTGQPGQALEESYTQFTEGMIRDSLTNVNKAIAEAEEVYWNKEGKYSKEEVEAAKSALFAQLTPEGKAGEGSLYAAREQLQAYIELQEQAEAEGKAAWGQVQGAFNSPITGVIELSLSLPTLPAGLSWSGWNGLKKKAKGGRETTPSIFAEAGIPEWYIPEEHTSNTGKLLLAAAENSGFSMAELIKLSGAKLFADGGTDGSGDTLATLQWGSMGGSTVNNGGDINVQYSPTINGDGGSGIEQKLREDKERYRKFFEEFMAERELYRSMAAYA